MRLSIDKRDPGYRPQAELQQYRVLFNGVERRDCHTADEEQGYIKTVRTRRTAPWLPPTILVGPAIHGKVEIQKK